jgi:hypothetical protein
VKRTPDPTKASLLAINAMMAARAILTVTLLLTLVAGSIAWPAAASGPLCTLSCCAGKAPHAVGSCMHGSCDTDMPAQQAAIKVSHTAHHHQQPAEQSSPSGAFAGVVASVGGSDLAEVPTIEAIPYQPSANDGSRTNTAESNANGSDSVSMQAVVLSRPCQSDCGACAPGFAAPKRSRDAAVLTGHYQAQPSSQVKLAGGKHTLNYVNSVFYRQSTPRGPPPTSSY